MRTPPADCVRSRAGARRGARLAHNPNLEGVSPSEPADIATIVDGILKVQSRDAADQNRPLARGTHAKGVCARAEFEVLDVMSTVADRTLAARLARGLYATPGRYPATLRFANADSNINNDSKPDVRALSFAVEAPGKTAPGLLDQRSDHVPNQRRARVCDDHQGRDGADDGRWGLGVAVQGKAVVCQDGRSRAAPGASVHASLPTATLLEHRAVPSWPVRRHQVLRSHRA